MKGKSLDDILQVTPPRREMPEGEELGASRVSCCAQGVGRYPGAEWQGGYASLSIRPSRIRELFRRWQVVRGRVQRA